jgi:uncharacterized membrane protein AbrB (regulator of aidB expression)
MKYIGYVLLLLSGVAGYLGVRVWFVVLLALLSAFVFASARRKNLKETPQAPDQNMLIDGVYLFLGQLLIMFAIYLLGVFIGSPGGELFGDFLSGKRVGPDAGISE